MDRFKKRPPWEEYLGRLVRNMSFPGTEPFLSGSWSAATDVYETARDLVMYMELAGVDPGKVSVVVEEQKIIISGERRYPVPDRVRHIHQLEIERGFFEKSVSLPKPIDVTAASSVYQNGFLVITMPKQRNVGKVRIKVR